MTRFISTNDDFDPSTECGLCGAPLNEKGDYARHNRGDQTMKRNMTHSPLPWKRGTDGLVYDANDEFVVDTCGASLPPEGEENQKFIVHVVNTHQQLLDACENALGAYDALEVSGVASRLPGHASCLKDLKDAIAKATD